MRQYTTDCLPSDGSGWTLGMACHKTPTVPDVVAPLDLAGGPKTAQYNNEDAPSVDMARRADIIVSGLVQGVGFRYMVRCAARQCRLKGEVENLEDETVRITCEGEERDVVKFVKAVRGAKKPIEIDDVRIEYSEPTGGFKNFRVILGDQLTEMSEGFGTGSAYLSLILDKQDQMLNKADRMLDKQDQMLDKQDQMLDKQDQMLDKQDQMLDKQDQMLDKQDQMLDKQDVTTNEIRSLSSSMHDMMDARFQRLEEEISKIKARLPDSYRKVG